jgi:hypothetical protein
LNCCSYAHNNDTGRQTEDVDFAVMVPDWDAFAKLRTALITGDDSVERPGPATHRLRHKSGMPLNVVPFGGIERADRISLHRPFCRNARSKKFTPAPEIEKMSTYRVRTLHDAGNVIYQSGLCLWDWPNGGSPTGFANWLFVQAKSEINTQQLASDLRDYLEGIGSSYDNDPCGKVALDRGKAIDDYNFRVAEIGATIARIRALEHGNETMRNVAKLATAKEPSEFLNSLPATCLPDIAHALDALVTPTMRFNPTMYDDYVPGTSIYEDALIAHTAATLDESLASELKWDGRDKYRVLEVVAIVRLGQSQEIRALVIDRHMAAIIKAHGHQTSGVVPRKRAQLRV